MIIYFTKNFDVYKCPHFKTYHVHALQCIWWVLKLLFKIFLFKEIFLIGSFLFKISLSHFSEILFSFISFFPFGIKGRFCVNRKVSILTIRFPFPSLPIYPLCIYIKGVKIWEIQIELSWRIFSTFGRSSTQFENFDLNSFTRSLSP